MSGTRYLKITKVKKGNEKMSKSYEALKSEFKRIEQMGWVESSRSGDTGIGKTFEDLLDKIEDNLALPDFDDIEIKTQRQATSSMITLFTKSPDFPRKVNTLLREEYGSDSPQYDGMKILHTTIKSTGFNTHIGGYEFKIDVDQDLQRLVLVVRDSTSKNIVAENIYWAFQKIENALEKKLKFIAYVTADEKKENAKTYFKFNNIRLLTGLTLGRFLQALQDGYIMVDIRIGVYNTGKNKGKTHDHGTGFRIKLEHLMNYAEIV